MKKAGKAGRGSCSILIIVVFLLSAFLAVSEACCSGDSLPNNGKPEVYGGSRQSLQMYVKRRHDKWGRRG